MGDAHERLGASRTMGRGSQGRAQHHRRGPIDLVPRSAAARALAPRAAHARYGPAHAASPHAAPAPAGPRAWRQQQPPHRATRMHSPPSRTPSRRARPPCRRRSAQPLPTSWRPVRIAGWPPSRPAGALWQAARFTRTTCPRRCPCGPPSAARCRGAGALGEQEAQVVLGQAAEGLRVLACAAPGGALTGLQARRTAPVCSWHVGEARTTTRLAPPA